MMINLLNLPQFYDRDIIETSNTIFTLLKNNGMDCQYDINKKKIIIINSQHKDLFYVQMLLLTNYQLWVPVVGKENNGNLFVHLRSTQSIEQEIFAKLSQNILR